MDAKIYVTGDHINQASIDELNRYTDKCCFLIVKRLGYAPLPPEVVLVMIELLRNLEYSATYDLIKMALLSLISKLKKIPRTTTRIKVVVDDKMSEIIIPFEISDEQKEKLVDAAIEKFRK